jgi:hypothetical protein
MSKGAEGGATAANKLCIWSDAIKAKRLCRFSPWRVVLLLLLLSNSGWNNIMTPRFCVFGKRGRTVGSHSRPPTKQSTTIEIIWWPSHTQGHISNSGALKKNRRWGSWASGRQLYKKKVARWVPGYYNSGGDIFFFPFSTDRRRDENEWGFTVISTYNVLGVYSTRKRELR